MSPCKVSHGRRALLGTLLLATAALAGHSVAQASAPKLEKEQLKPGAQITAEYTDRAGQKIAKSVEIKG